ncbi:MAG: sce7726 family protein [Caulobacter sp.]|nr:sce7726 family protein [Caulobacter sp.]
MALNSTQLSATSRLFSSSIFRELAAKGKSSLFTRLVRESPLLDLSTTLATVGDAFEAAFHLLRTGAHRDEYIYKAALTRNVLLGKHGLNTASMLTEFRVGACRADLAILNGTATVYEIKSERDSLSRLGSQVEAYQKVFAKVFVIAGENHVDAVLRSTAPDIGVMLLSKRHRISTVREATDRPDRICPVTVFESIRSSEAIRILRDLGIDVPKVPNTLLHAELRSIFSGLDADATHRSMVKTLKKTRNLAPLSELISDLPPSLQAAALTVSVKKTDHPRLVHAVNTPFADAMGWA